MKVLKIIFCFIFCVNLSFAQNLENILSELQNSTSININFKHNDISYLLNTSGDKFILENEYIDILFDGDNLYTYNKTNEELTIEKLTNQSVLTNPTLIFGLNSREFDFTNTGNKYTITPKDKESIGLNTIIIELNGKKIENIDISPISGDNVFLDIVDIRANEKIDSKDFKFDKKKYPNAEIIDFR